MRRTSVKQENPAAQWLHLMALYVRSIGKWLALAVVIGLVCGVIGTAFHMGVHEATLLRGEHPWLLW